MYFVLHEGKIVVQRKEFYKVQMEQDIKLFTCLDLLRGSGLSSTQKATKYRVYVS